MLLFLAWLTFFLSDKSSLASISDLFNIYRNNMLLWQEIALSVFTFFHYYGTYGFHYTSELATMKRDQGLGKKFHSDHFLVTQSPWPANLVDSNARNWGLWAMSSLPRYSQICESHQGSAFVLINVELKSQIISLRQF